MGVGRGRGRGTARRGLTSALMGYDLLFKVGAGIVMLLVAFGVGFVKGYDHGSKKLQDLLIAQAAAATRMVAKQGEEAAKTEAIVRPAVVKVRTVTETIVKEIPIYVQEPAVHCVVPNGFVVLHDAAAIGSPPSPPSESDRIDSGYGLTQVLEANAHNLGALRECRVKLGETIKFYNQLRKQ